MVAANRYTLPYVTELDHLVEDADDNLLLSGTVIDAPGNMSWHHGDWFVLTVCLGKSTYARCGIIVNVTPLEPEWEGHVTLEFSNTTTLPAKVYANEGVAQMLFFQSDERCETTYKDRGGKYQGQRGVTLPKP